LADAGQIDDDARARVSPETTTGNTHRTLLVHPDAVCAAVNQIEVEVARPRPGTLLFSYVITGTINGLLIPPLADAARTDDLWRHTCFEAFLRDSGGERYYELNFAPSTRWAAYVFSSYRTGRRDAPEIDACAIRVEAGPGHYRLGASIEVDRLPLFTATGWRLGLAAVIEETNGHHSYWALAHPPGKPDFHHADCFTLEVP
jgi:hypothetical protein